MANKFTRLWIVHAPLDMLGRMPVLANTVQTCQPRQYWITSHCWVLDTLAMCWICQTLMKLFVSVQAQQRLYWASYSFKQFSFFLCLGQIKLLPIRLHSTACRAWVYLLRQTMSHRLPASLTPSTFYCLTRAAIFSWSRRSRSSCTYIVFWM